MAAVLEVERLDKVERLNKERIRRNRWVRKRERNMERDERERQRVEQERVRVEQERLAIEQTRLQGVELQAAVVREAEREERHPRTVRTVDEERARTEKLINERLYRDNKVSVNVGPFVRLIGWFKKKGQPSSISFSLSLSHTHTHTPFTVLRQTVADDDVERDIYTATSSGGFLLYFIMKM